MDGVNYETQSYAGDIAAYKDLEYTNGEGYVFESVLTPGSHSYSFTCSDGIDVANSGDMTITVETSSAADDDVSDDDANPTDDDASDDDGAQGSGGFGGHALYYVLGGAGRCSYWRSSSPSS